MHTYGVRMELDLFAICGPRGKGVATRLHGLAKVSSLIYHLLYHRMYGPVQYVLRIVVGRV